jgi:hypothetical protein
MRIKHTWPPHPESFFEPLTAMPLAQAPAHQIQIS